MATNPFGAGIRPWRRITAALRTLSTDVLGKGELIVDDAGKMYVPDGVKQVKDLSALTTAAEVSAAYLSKAQGVTATVDASGGVTLYLNGVEL